MAPPPVQQAAPALDKTAEVRKTLGLDKNKRVGRIIRWVVLGLAAAAAVGGSVRWFQGRAARSAPTYETARIARGDLEITVTATGKVEGLNTVEVGAEVSGRVLKITVDFNDRVKKGQLLAEIDPEQTRAAVRQAQAQTASARAQIAEAKATIAQTKASAARAHAQQAQGLMSLQDVETADAVKARAEASLASGEAAAALAQATLASAKYRLDRTIINSPIDGIVLARLVEPGQTVTAGFQTPILFKLAEDLTQMTLHIDVDEADIGHVAEGQAASFTVDAYPERIFPSKVESLRNEPKTSQNVVTYEGVLTVDNHDRALRPGMTATATIVADKKRNVVLVPNAALRFAPKPKPGEKAAATSTDKAGERRVWILDGLTPKPLSVKVGATDGRLTELPGAELGVGDAVIVDAVVKD